MNPRRYLFVATLLVVALISASCGGDSPDASSPDLVPVKMILGFVPQGQDSPFYLGIDKGFFEDEGIDLTILSGEGSAVATSTVAAEGAEFGISDLATVVLAQAEDDSTPVKAVASLHAVAPYSIFSLADGANMDEPSDLNGATIHVNSQSTLRQLFDAWAAKVGITGYSFGEADQTSASQLLLAGEIPNNVSFITNKSELEEAAEQGGKELVSLWLGEHGMDDFYGNSLVVNSDFAAENPELVEGFVRAFLRSLEYGFENPDEAADGMEEAFPTVQASGTLQRLTHFEQLVTAGGAPIGELSADKVASTIAYVKDGLDLDATVTPEDVVLEGYLK